MFRKNDGLDLRIETLFAAFSFFCFFLCINFVMFPMYVIVDQQLKAQFLALATSLFVGGVVSIILFTAIKLISKSK
jgi:hypothetical protein